jgi:hypothetical protein
VATKSLGTLTLDVLVKTGSFIEGLSKGERSTKKFAADVQKNLASAGKAFTGLVAGATAATAALLKSSIDAAAGIDDIAQASGASVESLSALKYAAGLEGVAFESLTASVAKFSRTINDARDEGSAAATTFKGLGISIRDSEGNLRATDDLLLDVADRFAGLQDGATKAAYAQQLFGRSGADLIPFLNRGRDGIAELTDEAERFGLIIGADTAARADEFNDNLYRFQSIIRGTGVQLAEALLPQLVEFTDLVKDPATQQAIQSIVVGIADIATTAVKGTTSIAEFAVGIRDMVKSAAESLSAQFNGVALDDLQRIPGHIVTLQNALENLRATNAGDDETIKANIAARIEAVEAELATYEEAYKRLANARENAGVNDSELTEIRAPNLIPQAVIDPEANERAAALQELVKERLEDYQKEVALVGEVTELQKLRYEIESGALQGITEDSALKLETLAREIDANEALAKANEQREEKQKEQLKLAQEAQKAFDDRVAGLEREIALYGDLTRAEEFQYEVTAGNLQDLTAQQREQLGGLYARLDVLDKIAEEEKKAAEIAKEQQERIAEFGKQAARAVQGHFADVLSGVESSFSDTISRISAEWASSQLLTSLAGALGNSSNPLLQKVGGIFAGAFADGGMIPAGQFGLTGENGPELVTGPAYVHSAKETAAMMGNGRSLSINLSLPGISNANEATRATSTILRATRNALLQSERYG